MTRTNRTAQHNKSMLVYINTKTQTLIRQHLYKQLEIANPANIF